MLFSCKTRLEDLVKRTHSSIIAIFSKTTNRHVRSGEEDRLVANILRQKPFQMQEDHIVASGHRGMGNTG